MTAKALLGIDINPFSIINWNYCWWASDPLWAPTDGVAIPNWFSRSGGTDVLSSSSGQFPLYRASTAAFGSRPTVQGDGVNDKSFASPLSIAQPLSAVIVGSMTGGTFPSLVNGGDATGGSDLMCLYRSTSGYFKMYAGSADIGPSSGDANPHCFNMYLNGASSRLDIGSSRYTGNPGTRGFIDRVSALGAAYTTSNLSNAGHIAFLGLYSGDVTTHPKWTFFKSWLARYYGGLSELT